MTPDELCSLKEWFIAYVASFSTSNGDDQRNITLKQVHSDEVRLNAVRIAHDLGMPLPAARLAEAAALLHDVGRFTQYQQYRTFDDSISANHAALGAMVLRGSSALDSLSEHDRQIITRSLMLHNVFSLPDEIDDETLLFARLVRDADKLDIFRVFLEYFNTDKSMRSGAVVLGLPESADYSSEMVACLLKGEMAPKSLLKTTNDIKLLQLSWVYDLNFPCSFRMIVERDIIRSVSDTLPRTEEIASAIAAVQRHIEKNIQRP